MKRGYAPLVLLLVAGCFDDFDRFHLAASGFDGPVDAPADAGGDAATCTDCSQGTCHNGVCCLGCWDGTACRAGTDVTQCGANGLDCKVCNDGMECTADRCTNGTCGADPETGPTCSIGVCASGVCECGGMGEPCCTTGTQCQGSQTCQNGHCGSCGAANTPCCANSQCSAGNVCNTSTGNCEVCGAPNDLCCANQACQAGTVCGGDSHCHSCGADGQPCCTQGQACTGSVCVSGTCRCGGTGQPCCGGTTCAAGCCGGGTCAAGTDPGMCGGPGTMCMACGGSQVCQNQSCQNCGGNGQPCCPTNMCDNTALSCSSNTCRACVAQIDSGFIHTCAYKLNGSAWCWGGDAYGQIGQNPTLFIPPQPIQVNITNVVEVSEGGNHSCARKSDGSVWCWGDNQFGQLGNGGTNNSWDPVEVRLAAGGFLTNVAHVSAGDTLTCALMNDQTVFCWGQFTPGGANQMTAEPMVLPDGTTLLSSVVEVSSGRQHVCARKSDNTIWCLGSNASLQLGASSSTSSSSSFIRVQGLPGTLVQIQAGGDHNCVRKSDNTVWCWGSNSAGQLGANPSSVTTSATPLQVPGLSGTLVEIAAGRNHNCARKSDATTWCWGSNSNGQLGSNPMTITRSATPLQVLGLSNPVQLTGGESLTCARTADGPTYCWGAGGLLGDGTTQDSYTPVITVFTCP